MIAIVLMILDEVCVRKRSFLFHEFVVRLLFARESGGDVRATRAVVDELVRIFANGTADRRQGLIRVVVCDDRVRRGLVLNPVDQRIEEVCSVDQGRMLFKSAI